MTASTVSNVSNASSVESAEAAEARLRRELAAVYRLVHHFQMTDLIFTHISARLPGAEHRFLINRYGLMFDEVTASNLVVVDLDGNLVDAQPAATVNPAGFVIHSAIHRSREDAQCVLHTHTRAGCAVAAQADGLLPLNQMSLMFYDRVGYHDYEGVALNRDEQERLVANLGENHSLILRNHGLLTVGTSPAEAFVRMFYLNRACQLQVDALAGGTAVVLPSAEICEHVVRQFEGTEASDDYADAAGEQLLWEALLRLVERHYPDYRN